MRATTAKKKSFKVKVLGHNVHRLDYHWTKSDGMRFRFVHEYQFQGHPREAYKGSHLFQGEVMKELVRNHPDYKALEVELSELKLRLTTIKLTADFEPVE